MRYPQRNDLDDRFWSKVTPEGLSGCWLWTGALRNGYGHFWLLGKGVSAHRVSYEMTTGPIGDLSVLHKCDNRVCVNPDHLFLGTSLDNARDRHVKGRDGSHRGEANGRAKLSRADVGTIRQRVGSGETGAALGRAYGVNRNTIYAIVRGTNWSNDI